MTGRQREVQVLQPLDVEITIRPGGRASRYEVRLSYRLPNGDADIDGVARRATAEIDPAALRVDWLRMDSYAQKLTAGMFADPDLCADMRRVTDLAAARGAPVRLRLLIDPAAVDLQAVRWEALRDPNDDRPLATSDRLWFSRYLPTTDPVDIPELTAGKLRTLLVVASPTDSERLRLAPIDVDAELARATAAIAPIARTTVLARPPAGSSTAVDGPPTLEAMVERLRAGVDLLIVVAHGRLVDGSPRVYLERPSGAADVITGPEFLTRIDELTAPPRLVVLISCESASPAKDRLGALSALGPGLAGVGVPAVVAMQGDLSMRTSERFTRTLFTELAGHGQIDRAVSVARGAVRDEPDSWMPALFMRLNSGLLWGRPGTGGPRPEFDKWPVVVQRIREGTCTPVLGPGLLESLLGSTRDIAQSWAREHDFPLAEQASSDLPQVTQYLAVHLSDPDYPRTELRRFLKKALIDKYGTHLPDAMRATDPQEVDLTSLVSAVGAYRRATEPTEPHQVLAGLPFRMYITTNPDDFMEQAVREARHDGRPRVPHVEICRWNESIVWRSEWDGGATTYQPSVQEPLVYHLFGDFATDRSIVLTEDDHFDYLIGVGRNAPAIPPPVMRAIKDHALLFLGFRIDTWNFRVLFRSIVNLALGGRRPRPHIAVQVDPADGSSVDPEGARRYLEAYFGQEDISIYWGTVDALIGELQEQLR